MANSVVRDHFTPQIDRLVTNSGKLYKEIRQYLSRKSVNLLRKGRIISGKRTNF